MKIINILKEKILLIFKSNKRLSNANIITNTFEEQLLTEFGNCNEKKYHNLKLLIITDTHNCLTYDNESLEYLKNITNYDYCILLGDHSADDLYEITKIIPKEKICGVLGNHDSWEKYKEYDIENINGKVININGIRIAGISGSFKYKNSDQYALYTHEESIEIANNMTEADILVSHDKPFTEKQYGDAHDGLKGVTQYIYKNHIPVHIHGHLHEETEEILKNGTKSIGLYKIKVLEL